MKAEQIKELLDAQPFVPFTIHIPDRPPTPVPHPDFAQLGPRGDHIVVWVRDGIAARILSTALITELEPKQAA